MIAKLRAIVFYIGYVITGILFGALALPLMLFPYSLRAPVLVAWNRFCLFWLKVCCGVRIDIRGNKESLTRPCVILANHQSSWETLFLQAHFSPVATILKQELLNIPFFGWGLRALRSIPIDRGNPREALKKIRKEGVARLDDGISVLVFPEGTRKEPGELGNFARSGADIAIAANVPVVAVAHNAGVFWAPHKLAKQAGVVTVSISDMISSEDRNSKELTQEVRNWIEQHSV
ncbi:lysophospholipid acyltransferase family protein [Pseudoteredinibacter isoporae]|uniref:1-acyl-sn-glycerol-3-phosphate acyltransferase n=1 Tax=Pseudoteredinibacter isoporae TaxID=570281 RepID=A0A7X0MVT0_9GAMM|nr:lysophospholipid acyltransferase family protein [Pseudoteredinibacter isoporae]MBB6520174.1 1-acyl-sn-glycerol-3-phosphate acyltransferase [Pseudoteredinibacter isoporae]